MDEATLRQLMDKYGDVTYKRDVIAMEKKQLRDKIIPPEIQLELEALDEEFKSKEQALDLEEKAGRKVLDDAVKLYTKSLELIDKITIKSELMTLTVSKGDAVWDVDGIDGYAIAHPEILFFRKEQPPKTRITKNRI